MMAVLKGTLRTPQIRYGFTVVYTYFWFAVCLLIQASNFSFTNEKKTEKEKKSVSPSKFFELVSGLFEMHTICPKVCGQLTITHICSSSNCGHGVGRTSKNCVGWLFVYSSIKGTSSPFPGCNLFTFVYIQPTVFWKHITTTMLDLFVCAHLAELLKKIMRRYVSS